MPTKAKNMFRDASPDGKRNIIKDYQINPRNTSSSSYAVEGLDTKMRAYYNVMPDKWKAKVLAQPIDRRMDFVEYIQALESKQPKFIIKK
jgi:hypothetical protein